MQIKIQATSVFHQEPSLFRKIVWNFELCELSRFHLYWDKLGIEIGLLLRSCYHTYQPLQLLPTTPLDLVTQHPARNLSFSVRLEIHV